MRDGITLCKPSLVYSVLSCFERFLLHYQNVVLGYLVAFTYSTHDLKYDLSPSFQMRAFRAASKERAMGRAAAAMEKEDDSEW